jgi:hypothetical protein
MVQALMLRAAAGRAAAAGFWKTRRFCTASNAAIGRLWVWGVSHIALPSWSASPPHAPQTHGRVQTQLHQGAGCACADLDRATPHTHAARPRPARRRPTAPMLGAPSGMRAMARGAASADPRGSCHQPRRYHVSPAKLAPPAYPPWRNPARCDPESLGFSLYKMHSL